MLCNTPQKHKGTKLRNQPASASPSFTNNKKMKELESRDVQRIILKGKLHRIEIFPPNIQNHPFRCVSSFPYWTKLTENGNTISIIILTMSRYIFYGTKQPISGLLAPYSTCPFWVKGCVRIISAIYDCVLLHLLVHSSKHVVVQCGNAVYWTPNITTELICCMAGAVKQSL